MSLKVGAIEFLLGDGGHPWIPTECWTVPRDGAKSTDLDAWDIALTDPGRGPKFHIADLKRWMLFGSKPERFFHLSPHGSKTTDARRIRREDALARYLEAVLAKIPPERRDSSMAVLTPAIRDEKERKRYHDAIRRVLPSARLLPEPEMVVDYFRLVQRTLTLDADRNNVILVIDIGASTSNATIVLSNRGGDIIGGDFQKQRDNRLRAIPGTCGDKAGLWVDERLGSNTGLLQNGLPFAERHRILRQIEQAKITVSRSGLPVEIQGASNGAAYSLTAADVERVAKQVVDGLEPILAELKVRLWKQMTGTPAAQRLSGPVLKDRQVSSAETALRLVDVVLLAGGTSRLRGFREQLETLFGQHKPKVLEVGESFAVAAAVGAIAHICHAKYNPPRLRHAGHSASLDEPSLEGALNVDVQFAWKPQKSQDGEKENRTTILERGDPIVYSGGERRDAIQLPVDAEVELRARLIPDIGIKRYKKGLSPHIVVPQVANPTLGFRIDGDRNMLMLGSTVRGVSDVRIDLKRFDRIEELAPTRHSSEIPAGQLAFDETDEVVLDFGMSKTVAVAVRTGLLDPRDLDRLVGTSAASGGALVAQPVAVSPRSPSTQPDPLTPSDAVSSTPPPTSMEPTVPERSSAQEPTEPAPTPGLFTIETSRAHTVEQSTSVSAPETEPSSSDRPVELPVSTIPSAVPPTPESGALAPAPAAVTAASIGKQVESVSDEEPQQPEETFGGGPISAMASGAGHLPRTIEGFMPALMTFLSAARQQGVDVPERDLMFTLLGLSVRPFLLLAGPPGCGKSTLARIVAHLLNREPGRTFHEVPVQAHWVSDVPLFGQRGVLRPVVEDLESTHVVLFDEINLTRPEYYLSRMLPAVEAPLKKDTHGLCIARTLCIGTLNIDDTSRPPSPKIIDRCFLVEVDAVAHTHELRPSGAAILPNLPALPGLPDAWQSQLGDLDPFLRLLIEQLEKTVRERGLRQDLLPSRRVLGDLQKVIALHSELGAEAGVLLSKDELIDRLIVNRILVKLAGPIDQVEDAILCVEKLIKPKEAQFERSMRRINLARQQKRLGFVSPWQ